MKKLLLLLILLGSCAKQMAPSGGPVDKTPPEIISVFPAHKAINVACDIKVMIEFSERMERKSVERAIFISPRQSEELKYKWKGRKLFIQFPDTLKKNTTYVLTIGTDAADLRRNRMKESFHLAFSTGDKLNQGKISGTVYGTGNIEGTIVNAYSLKPGKDPDPTRDFAEYVTQCNARGSYQFSYISPGWYRLFAIGDRDSDQKYDHGIEALGIASADIRITDKRLTVNHVDFRIMVRDTVLPAIKSVIDIDKFHVDVRFSEPMSPIGNEMKQSHFLITREKNARDTLKIIDYYQNSIEKERFHLKTEQQVAGESYLLIAKNLFDLAGNPLDSSFQSYVFKGSARSDTLKPRLLQQSLANHQKNVPLDTKIQFVFSEVLVCSTFEQHFNLSDSNKTTIAGTFLWQNPADVTFTPQKWLASKMKYLVYIAVDSVIDEAGNSLADSTLSFDFTTLNKDTLSAISGNVYDEKETARGKIYLTAFQTGNSNVAYHTVLDSVGSYHFKNIFPGLYLIKGFRDEDGNGTYSFGKINPYVPAERFVFYPDTIKVRSRWPNEGNDITIKWLKE